MEAKGQNSPDYMAFEAIQKHWQSANMNANTKARDVAILEAFKITPGMHRGEAFDDSKAMPWFLGQVFEAINSENNKDLNALMMYANRYITSEFFGQNMHSLFEKSRVLEDFERRNLEKAYPASEDWMGHNDVREGEIFLKYGIDQKIFGGREVVVLMGGEFPDQLPYLVTGKLSRDSKRRSSICLIKTKGGMVEVDLNHALDYKVKDTGIPTYQQLITLAKDDGFSVLSEYDTELSVGQEVRWILPNTETGTWNLVHGKVTKPRRGGSALFEIESQGRKYELNTNHFYSEGNKLYLKKK